VGVCMSDAAPREDGLILIAGDIDRCVNPDTGELTDRAADIVDRLATYTELSPSHTGVRLFFWGRRPPCLQGGRRAGNVEFYWREHYLTITGQTVPGVPSAYIEERADEFEALYRDLFSDDPDGKDADGELEYEPGTNIKNPDLTPEQVLAWLKRRNGPKGDVI